jgi:hypothetical protein
LKWSYKLIPNVEFLINLGNAMLIDNSIKIKIRELLHLIFKAQKEENYKEVIEEIEVIC